MLLTDRGNGCRLSNDPSGGHYESWFLRANHPSRPLAFWIRYTIFAPRHSSPGRRGELWAIFFHGESGDVTSVKEEFPLEACRFGKSQLDVTVGDAELDENRLAGAAALRGNRIHWNLEYSSPENPLLLLPMALYPAPFPKAKALVPAPNARFHGVLNVNGEAIAVENWQGSQNHNWGSRHTEQYAWGQVAGFDDAPEAFLECTTARVRLGPMWSPWLSFVVLRLGEVELRFNSVRQALRARGTYCPFDWQLRTGNESHRLQMRFTADPKLSARLQYGNPPGGVKTCLNSKLAQCELQLEHEGRLRQLTCTQRGAFEILS